MYRHHEDGVPENQADQWVLLADTKRARLLRCSLTERGRCRVEESGSIENTRPRRQYGRSSPLWKNTTTTFGIRDKDEDWRPFAREVAIWLEREMERLGIRRVHILASCRFLDALHRTRYLRSSRQRLLERRVDLMHLSSDKLAKHPVIRQLVSETCAVARLKTRAYGRGNPPSVSHTASSCRRGTVARSLLAWLFARPARWSGATAR